MRDLVGSGYFLSIAHNFDLFIYWKNLFIGKQSKDFMVVDKMSIWVLWWNNMNVKACLLPTPRIVSIDTCHCENCASNEKCSNLETDSGKSINTN